MKNLYVFLILGLAFFTNCTTSPNTDSTKQVTPLPVESPSPEFVTELAPVDAYVAPHIETSKNPEQFGTIISDNANLRENGSSESMIIDTIPKGAEIEILKRKNGWYYVEVDEKTGWLHGNTFRFGKITEESDEDEAEIFTVEKNLEQIETPQTTYSNTPPESDTYTYSRPAPTPRTVEQPEYNNDDSGNYSSYGRADSKTVNNYETPVKSTEYFTPQYSSPNYSSPLYTPSYTPSYNPSPGVERVRGYTRRDGTYVAPHYRTQRDSTTLNNWSTRGNTNPYTGRRGSRRP